eukprot:scaffold149006_cov53-Attheya_sp.AAC.2
MGCPGQYLEGTFLAAAILAVAAVVAITIKSGWRLVVRAAFQESRRQCDALSVHLQVGIGSYIVGCTPEFLFHLLGVLVSCPRPPRTFRGTVHKKE